MAGLLKYFSVKQHKNDGDGKSNCLPNSNGELSKVVPSSSIEATNTVVHEVLEKRSPRGPYISLTPVQKYSFGKRAAENGTTATLCYYAPIIVNPHPPQVGQWWGLLGICKSYLTNSPPLGTILCYKSPTIPWT